MLTLYNYAVQKYTSRIDSNDFNQTLEFKAYFN